MKVRRVVHVCAGDKFRDLRVVRAVKRVDSARSISLTALFDSNWPPDIFLPRSEILSPRLPSLSGDPGEPLSG